MKAFTLVSVLLATGCMSSDNACDTEESCADADLMNQAYEDATTDFSDRSHLRPDAYERVGLLVGEQLAPLLSAASKSHRDLVTAGDTDAGADDPRANIYPIW